MLHLNPLKTLTLLGIATLAVLAFPAGALTPETSAQADVSVFDFGYEDAGTATPVTVIGTGDSVTWNWDSGTHSVTDQLGAFDSGLRSAGSARAFTVNFDEPGVHAYFCTIHPSMHGVVVVA